MQWTRTVTQVPLLPDISHTGKKPGNSKNPQEGRNNIFFRLLNQRYFLKTSARALFVCRIKSKQRVGGEKKSQVNRTLFPLTRTRKLHFTDKLIKMQERTRLTFTWSKISALLVGTVNSRALTSVITVHCVI